MQTQNAECEPEQQTLVPSLAVNPTRFGIEYLPKLIAVLVACFAATTLDTATRLQRYVIQELAETLKIKPLANKYVAAAKSEISPSLSAVLGIPRGNSCQCFIVRVDHPHSNQLLAGLAFLVTVFYLWRRGKPIWFAAIPMVFMIA